MTAKSLKIFKFELDVHDYVREIYIRKKNSFQFVQRVLLPK